MTYLAYLYLVHRNTYGDIIAAAAVAVAVAVTVAVIVAVTAVVVEIDELMTDAIFINDSPLSSSLSSSSSMTLLLLLLSPPPSTDTPRLLLTSLFIQNLTYV